ncbi:MAG: pyridoxal phosphate-dependent aminotransferase [Spirochaetia bacterium]|nr:pyridoxal phosphate-dependent aminotransferase [Spirochaetia bacterium]
MNRLARAVHKRRLANLEILEIHSGDHDFAASFFPRSILLKAFAEFTENPGYKPDPRGSLRARQAISDFYQASFDYSISPDQILLTSGSSESYAWILRILASAGGETVLAPLPGYPLFEHIADYSRMKLVHSLEDTSDRVQSQELQTDAPVATLAVSPANPTGTVLTRVELAELENRTPAIIFDEVFSSFIWNSSVAGQHFPRPNRAPLRFTLNGISKLLALPWLKLSWILVEGESDRVSKALDRLDFISDTFLSVNSFAQFALPQLLEARREFAPGYLELFSRQRLEMIETLNSIPGFHADLPDGGFTIVVKYDESIKLDEEEFAVQLLDRTGVYVFPGYYFDIAGGRSLVVSFQQKPERFKDALGRLAQFASGL